MDLPRLRRACWNLRLAWLFAAGPIVGLAPLALIFGLSVGMRLAALCMVAFTAALIAVLVRGEYDRLSRVRGR
jgi:hypothetical protein